ncbi:hypothetical protein RAA17_03565 [Komagataeibacter rhaeticus]|nr:hypothetical protein [Komagataeibacter rhaeticus]
MAQLPARAVPACQPVLAPVRGTRDMTGGRRAAPRVPCRTMTAPWRATAQAAFAAPDAASMRQAMTTGQANRAAGP